MTDKLTLRTEPGERIDHRDFQHLADQSEDQAAAENQVVLSGTGSYILHGFVPSASGSTFTVTRDEYGRQGAAILARRSDEGVTYGHVLAGGQASRSLNTSNLSDAIWVVYVRFSLYDSDRGNRPFWNADSTAGGPIEYVQNIATRNLADWDLTIATLAVGAVGAEWVELCRFETASGVITPANTVDDRRPFFFEGRPNLSFDPTFDWAPNSASTSNADRAQFGIKDLRTFVRMVQTQLQGLIDPADFWYNDTANTTLLRRDGTNTITGTILPDADSNRSIGSGSNRLNTTYTEFLRGTQYAILDGDTSNVGVLFWPTGTSAEQCSIAASPTSGLGGNARLVVSAGVGAGTLTLDAAEVVMDVPPSFGSPQTRVKSVLAMRGMQVSAIAGSTTEDWTLAGTGSGAVVCNNATTDQSFWIPIDLPDNAIVTGAEARMQVTGALAQPRVYLWRLLKDGTSLTLRTGSPSYDTVATGSVFGTATPLTVDESTANRRFQSNIANLACEVRHIAGSGLTTQVLCIDVTYTISDMAGQ